MKVIADSKIPYITGLLEPYADVSYLEGAEISREDVADADALLVRTRTHCGASLLEGSRIRFIGTATIGTDHIDLDYCRSRGIEVRNAAGSNAGGVLQWVAGVLALLSMRRGWNPPEKTLGIVGVGNIGSLVARYAKEWGFSVLCSDPPREQRERLGKRDGFVPPEELAAMSDIITFHVPLTHAGVSEYPTRMLGSEAFLRQTMPGTTIINSSRGGIVCEPEVKRLVREGRNAYCVDTWLNEPEIDRELLELAEVATPHIAGYSAQGKANASAAVIRSLAEYAGLPLSGWYPEEVRPLSERGFISWEDMTGSIVNYFDAGAETVLLKSSPGRFEQMRRDYAYRQEYF